MEWLQVKERILGTWDIRIKVIEDPQRTIRITRKTIVKWEEEIAGKRNQGKCRKSLNGYNWEKRQNTLLLKGKNWKS